MTIQHYFHGKHILISGSSSGIGQSLAQYLHQYAEKIYICGRNKSKLESLSKEFPKFVPLAFDINDKEKCFESLNKIKKLDILIANAGTCEYINPPEFDSAIFERIIQTNFLGTVYLLESLLPLLRASKAGHFVSISSSVSFLPLPRAHAYGASKAALNYLTDTMRLSDANDKVAFTSIYPGFIKTPLTDKNDFKMPFIISSDEAARRMSKAIAKKKLEYHFPKKLTMTFKLIGCLPLALQVYILKRYF